MRFNDELKKSNFLSSKYLQLNHATCTYLIISSYKCAHVNNNNNNVSLTGDYFNFLSILFLQGKKHTGKIITLDRKSFDFE